MSTNETNETATKVTQSRWTSKILWASIAAQVIVLLQLTGAFKAIGLDAGLVGNVIAGIIGLLVTLGILNDPTNKEGY